MIAAKALAACLLLAAQTHHVPPAVMVGILHVEGGRVGQQVGPNTNGSYDLGPMQVNTTWVPTLARLWKTTPANAHKILRDNGCANMNVAAWILRQRIESTGSLFLGIAHYHSATPSRGHTYARKVIAAMDKHGLILHRGAEASPSAASNGQYARSYVRVAER